MPFLLPTPKAKRDPKQHKPRGSFSRDGEPHAFLELRHRNRLLRVKRTSNECDMESQELLCSADTPALLRFPHTTAVQMNSTISTS